MERCNIRGIGVVLYVSYDNANPTEKGLICWVYHMKLNYDMISYYNILYIYITFMIIFSNKEL
jgi:hypothetical protein